MIHIRMESLLNEQSKINHNIQGTENLKDKETGKVIVKINPKFFRSAEADILIGNPEKADTKLGWVREISFGELVNRMVDNDLELVKKEILRQVSYEQYRKNNEVF